MTLPPEGTMLVLSVGGVPLYSARDLEQSLEPIGAAAVTRRTINGTLIDLSVERFHKYRSKIQCSDVEAPALDGIMPGMAVTVDCVAEFVYKTAGGTPSRTVVSESARVVGDYTIYRRRLDMMVTGLQQRISEYDHEVRWDMDLEEVEMISTFYFAWVLSTETTFNGSHLREDELIFNFELRHEEGQFSELELEIINPHIGLLAPGRPLWAWFSWSDGVTNYPLFFGRLLTIPDDLFADTLRIRLVAKPKDYTEQLYALAATLRVLPHFDPLFIDASKMQDPDAVLEGYSALWHVDRTSHVVTKSDIIAGEDGVIEFTPNDVFYDSVKVKLSGSPLLVCEIDAETSWVQCDHTGVFEFSTEPGLVGSSNLGAGYTATSGLRGAGFSGGGANFTATFPADSQFSVNPQQRTESFSEKNISPGPHKDGDLMEYAESRTIPFYGGTLINRKEHIVHADPETGQGEEYSISESYKEEYDKPTPGGGGGGDTASPETNEIIVQTELEQERKEIIHVRVTADVQPVLSEVTEEDSIKQTLSLSTRDPVEIGLLSPSQGVYWSTDRGYQSVEYMLMVARAHLLAGSRVFETEWECPFPKLVTSLISCRKNATIEDTRLPGGLVVGKIVSYTMQGDGDLGEFLGGVSIASAVGNGNAITEVTGTPDYVNEGYVDIGYQHYSGRFVAATTNDMAFSPLEYVQSGIQVPVTQDQVLIRHEYNDSGRAQMINDLTATTANQSLNYTPSYAGQIVTTAPQELYDYSRQQADYDYALYKMMYDFPSWVELEFAPIQDIATEVEYDAEVSPLVIPKQVDLAAASTP